MGAGPGSPSAGRSSTARPGWSSERNGQPFSVGAFTIRDGRIVELDFLVDPERLARLDLTLLEGQAGR